VTLVGELALWLALLTSAWATIASAAVAWRSGVAFGGARGLARSAHRALVVAALALLVAAVALARALVTRDLSVAYVAAHVNANLPTPYALAALWSGGAGSLLLLTLFVATASAGATIGVRRWPVEERAQATAMLALTLTCLTTIVVLAARPFAREAWLAADGRGLNPELQHPLVLLHPLLVLAGEALSVVPFAFALGGSTRRSDAGWLRVALGVATPSWLALTAGIGVGMRWAYVQLGWGGVWNWDPVQNGALLVWLALTAFLHAAVVTRRAPVARRWTIALGATPLLASIAATALAHGGILASAHSFARSSAGPWLGGMLAALVALTLVIAVRRAERSGAPAAAEASVRTRTAAAFAASVLLAVIGAIVLFGTVFPLLGGWVLDEPVTVGGDWFVAVLTPIVLLVLALLVAGVVLPSRGRPTRRALVIATGALASGTAVAAVLALEGVRAAWVIAVMAIAAAAIVATMIELVVAWWAALVRRYGRATGSRPAFDGRRAAARLGHVAVAVLLLGLAGRGFERSRSVVLRPGEAFEIEDQFARKWRFVSQGVSLYDVANERVVAVTLEVTRDGDAMGLLRTAKRQPIDVEGHEIFDPSTEVAVRSTFWLDAYVVLENVNGEVARLRITFKPMMLWVFVGCGMAVLAGLVLAWPGSTRARRTGARPIVAPGEVVAADRRRVS
jgi:cytochrome c-type biogenesis protein CcmF